MFQTRLQTFASHLRDFWRGLTPPQLFVASFIGLIIFGTVGFKALPGIYTGESLTWLDAFFTSTSAVCVTGLIVVDTATYFTPLGQGFLLLLIQLGGLGIVTFATLIVHMLGERLSLRHESIIAGTPVVSHMNYHQLGRDVVRFTLVIEGVGAACLYAIWAPWFGWLPTIRHAVFHSVSAFCNAGFSTFSDSLVPFRFSPLTQTVIMVLIVLGGIGFVTLEELAMWRRLRRDGRFRLSLHSRLVLITTAILIVGGAVAYAAMEWNLAFAGMSSWARWMNALFMSVTCRTAGFNTVNYGDLADSTVFLTMVLMQIGGSPGSTAGGFKTTTVALLAVLSWSRIAGRQSVNCFNRTVPNDTIQRAVGLFVTVTVVVIACIFVFTLTDLAHLGHSKVAGRFLKLAFETVSAFNTVGLSMGVTPELTSTGRWMTILLMFAGRVGPLTLVAAMARRQKAGRGKDYRFAHEGVDVG